MQRIGVLDLVDDTGIGGARRDQLIVRRHQIAVVVEPDRVAGAEHDVVGAGAAVNRLVIIVAHRIGVGELLEIGHVPLLDVEKAHRRRTLFIGEAGRRRLAVAAGADRRFDPWEEVVLADRGTRERAAVELLPHLVEAVDRALHINVVEPRGDLVRARRQVVDEPCRHRRCAYPACRGSMWVQPPESERIIVDRQPVLDLHRLGDVRKGGCPRPSGR